MHSKGAQALRKSPYSKHSIAFYASNTYAFEFIHFYLDKPVGTDSLKQLVSSFLRNQSAIHRVTVQIIERSALLVD